MEPMTLGELAAVLIEAEKTGRPIEFNSLQNSPDTKTGWLLHAQQSFDLGLLAYRVRPEPPKPREWWLCEYTDGYGSLYDTPTCALAMQSVKREFVQLLHVREVLDDEVAP